MNILSSNKEVLGNSLLIGKTGESRNGREVLKYKSAAKELTSKNHDLKTAFKD